MYDSKNDTLNHIATVRTYMSQVTVNLAHRAAVHDASKLENPEKEVFDRVTPKLQEIEYGSDEYRRVLRDEMSAGIKHHYENNDHHPEWTRMNNEKWSSVVGYEDYYEVSNFGQVRSRDRIVSRSGKRGDMLVKGKLLTPHINPKGYLRLQLSCDGSPKSFLVHRLVAESFIPNPDNKPEVNHINGNKKDNRVSNLEWSTSSENQKHAYDTGLKHPVLKYVVICEELNVWTYGIEKMVEELQAIGYNASSGGIWNCLSGKSGSHCGLSFSSRNIEEYDPHSDLRFMSLLSIMEMVCDWKAASDRVNGNFADSLEINHERFNINDDLMEIIFNTCIELGWI